MNVHLDLTNRQKSALRGQLSADDFEREGMGLFKLGLVAIDPLSQGASSFPLTNDGKLAARYLRANNQ